MSWNRPVDTRRDEPLRRRAFAIAGSAAYFGAMIDDLYSARILALAANMPLAGRLDVSAPVSGWPGTGEQVARLCGSRAVVDVVLTPDGLKIRDFAQDIRACALGQAAAAILGESVLDATVDEVRAARDAMADMLKFGGEGPVGRFEGLRALKVVADYPARHASTLVALEATLKAMAEGLKARTDSRDAAAPVAGAAPAPGTVRARRDG